MKHAKAYLTTALFCLTFLSSTQAQMSDFCQDTKEGSFTLEADSSFRQAINNTLRMNARTKKIKGYRIQIYFGRNRREAKRRKSEFLRDYPDHEAYTLYQRPNFKVRVGNFRNKLEAQKLYYELSQLFNTVFIVPTRIAYPKLPQIN